ncbi:MerR family transcriptional regulator [Reticulibacter mediterranei]|uniref:MerR family transcriptional regulator n=2 Tax=Reticulibacter mediterranei TaxID=2778369 RepID=A0A8J3IUU8_9CHLR|nr:MerR family transcriptional regulator [Reticulibacter mediterranei]
MFTIGEFSRIAQVSTRLLRYYDEIGLLKPVHTDRGTGYRYYNAEQLLLLNRILALKDLGLSLEQIQLLIKGNISTDEIQGMFLLKKAQIEQQIQADLQRLRSIEARVQAMRHVEASLPIDVILKHVPAQSVLSVRTTIASFTAGLSLFDEVTAALPEKDIYGFRFCICHSKSFAKHNIDLEMGHLLEVASHAPVLLCDGLHLRFRELPAVAEMATYVVQGGLETIHAGYIDIGTWTETHGYHVVGMPREITLQAPQEPDGSDLITEIQFPVTLHHSA